MKHKYRVVETSEGEFSIQRRVEIPRFSRIKRRVFQFRNIYNWVYLTNQGFINTHWFNSCVKVFDYEEEAKEYLKEYLKYPIIYPEFKM